MKRIPAFLVALVVLASLFTGCSNPSEKTDNKVQGTEIMVCAAASLIDALTEIQRVYEQNSPGVKINFNFAASGILQHQIEQGAPSDLFISAGKKQMDVLEDKNLIDKESRTDLIGNDLVLVVSKYSTNISSFQDLTGPEISRISIGTPETVPAGKYAQETLESLNLWDVLKPKLVMAKDVRQVLSYVETGNVEAGLVYRSDAVSTNKLKIAAAAPFTSHKPIVYPAAVVPNSSNQEAAKTFLNFLQSDEALDIFKKHGFTTLN